jgi:hypothetical protein
MQKKQSVICVKIAQRQLEYYGEGAGNNRYSVFPYDRIYLVKNHLLQSFSRTFRYYFSMPLDKKLLLALNRMHVSTIRATNVQRDDLAKDGKTGDVKHNFQKLIPSPKKWTLVVPTHVRSVKYIKNGVKNGEKGAEHSVSVVQYFFTKAIHRGQQNSKVNMPRITFHTPERTVPVACAICKNTPSFYANECTPGTYECQQNHLIRIPEDRHFKHAQEKSVAETGGEQCL